MRNVGSKKTLLFVADSPISRNLTGSLLSHQIYSNLRELNWKFIFTPPAELFASKDLAKSEVAPLLTMVKPRERVPQRFGPVFGFLWAFIAWLWLEAFVSVMWSLRLRRLSKMDVDCSWLVLQGQASLVLFNILKRRTRAPIVVQVWDHMDWWMNANHIPFPFRNYYLKRYEQALRHADFVVTPSPAYSSFLSSEGKLKTDYLIAPISSSRSQNPLADLSDRIITIGFAGQIYAEREFSQFIDTLNKCSWTVSGYSIRLKIIGRGHAKDGRQIPRDRVQYIEWLDQENLNRELQHCHFLYCPYPQSPEMANISKYSFPSKLVNYLAVGRPILFHGRRDSAAWLWLEKLDLIHFCDVIDEKAIGSVIELSLSKNRLISARAQSQSLLGEEFSELCFSQKLNRIVDGASADGRAV